MSELRPSEKRGEPTVALFLTWFLPGAGHVYLGRFGVAALAFLLVEGITRKPVSIAIQNVATLAGIVLIGSVFLLVTFNDIRTLFGS